MEERSVKITLDKAREYYNMGGILKEIALQAFSEEELKNFKRFKSWKDIENYLDLTEYWMETLDSGQEALVKLDYIRKVLNVGYEMNLTKGKVCYPVIKFIKKGCTIYNGELNNGEFIKVGTIQDVVNNFYDVLSCGASYGATAGLGYFVSSNGVGLSDAHFGFLGCATKEIAEHMSRYFTREIFDAMYSGYVDYEWVDYESNNEEID